MSASGAIAAGKSFVARMLAEKAGAELIDADEIAHAVLEGDAEVKRRIIERWGAACLGADGEISRARLAGIVFARPDDLAELNRIMHPGIIREIDRKIENVRQQNAAKWIVLDAALLFETGLDSTCDITVFVQADLNTRVERARQRGWDADDLDRRQQAQLPPEYKSERSQYAVNNDGSRYETERQIEKLVELIKRHRRELNG